MTTVKEYINLYSRGFKTQTKWDTKKVSLEQDFILKDGEEIQLYAPL